MFHIDYIGVYILLFTDIHNIYIHLSILVFFYCMGFSIIFNTANNSFILLSKSKKLEGFNGIGLWYVVMDLNIPTRVLEVPWSNGLSEIWLRIFSFFNIFLPYLIKFLVECTKDAIQLQKVIKYGKNYWKKLVKTNRCSSCPEPSLMICTYFFASHQK